MRFDFSHDKPLTQNEISTIEKIVNKEALNNLEVKTELMKLDDAIKSGAMALFGEKYDDDVRVLTMGENSYSVSYVVALMLPELAILDSLLSQHNPV